MGLISLATGIAGTYLGAILKFRNDLKAKYDDDLRKMRICAYRKLWELTEPFAIYSPPGLLTYDELKEMSSKKREWYFRTGGWLLSSNCRDSYFSFQKKIKEVLEIATQNHKDSNRLDDTVLDDLKPKCSELRTSICKDIGMRAKPAFRSKD